jgi:hypothetical protein
MAPLPPFGELKHKNNKKKAISLPCTYMFKTLN